MHRLSLRFCHNESLEFLKSFSTIFPKKQLDQVFIKSIHFSQYHFWMTHEHFLFPDDLQDQERKCDT
jgi:hypothetical protein